jgi:hypothetical protein
MSQISYQKPKSAVHHLNVVLIPPKHTLLHFKIKEYLNIVL